MVVLDEGVSGFPGKAEGLPERTVIDHIRPLSIGYPYLRGRFLS